MTVIIFKGYALLKHNESLMLFRYTFLLFTSSIKIKLIFSCQMDLWIMITMQSLKLKEMAVL